jgi:hypothetical protein
MNWHKDLAMASAPESVIELVNEYLALMPSEADRHVPAHLRPASVGSTEEVLRWHNDLSDAVAGLEKPNLLLQDLCVVFVRAAARLAELRDDQAANGDDEAFGLQGPSRG